MSARDELFAAAAAHGWHSEIGTAVTFLRGPQHTRESVKIHFTARGSVTDAILWVPNGNVTPEGQPVYRAEGVYPRTVGKRETVLGWLCTEAV